jgi:hypothetical protein
MHYVAHTMLMGAAALSLAACATPEELAAAQQKAERRAETQTGSNIGRRDPASRTTAVTDKDAQDAIVNDMRNIPIKPVMGSPGTL